MQLYYALYDTDHRPSLRDFYDVTDSVLVYATETFIGVDKIIEKLGGAAKVIQRNISTSDCQPTNFDGFIVNIFGTVLLSGNSNLSFFNEMFVTRAKNSSYYIQNQNYRASGGNGVSDFLRFI